MAGTYTGTLSSHQLWVLDKDERVPEYWPQLDHHVPCICRDVLTPKTCMFIITMTSHGHHVVSNTLSEGCLFNSSYRPTSKPALLAFVRAIHQSPVNSPQKWPVKRKKLQCDDDVIMCVTFSNKIGP